MEIGILSNYDQNREKRLNSTMDIDHPANEEESNSSVNKVYEENSETKGFENQEDKRESSPMESESDDECEEEKLLLSPAHSVDGGEPLSPVNRDLLDSDCEGERDDFDSSLETDNINEIKLVEKTNEKELDAEEKEFDAQEKELGAQEKELDAQEKELNTQEKEVDAEKKELDEKDLEAEGKELDEKGLAEEEKELNAEEKQLNVEEKQLNAEEKQLNAEEKQLNTEEKQLNTEEKQLNAEEKQLNAEEKQLDAEAKSLDAENKELVTEETNKTEINVEQDDSDIRIREESNKSNDVINLEPMINKLDKVNDDKNKNVEHNNEQCDKKDSSEKPKTNNEVIDITEQLNEKESVVDTQIEDVTVIEDENDKVDKEKKVVEEEEIAEVTNNKNPKVTEKKSCKEIETEKDKTSKITEIDITDDIEVSENKNKEKESSNKNDTAENNATITIDEETVSESKENHNSSNDVEEVQEEEDDDMDDFDPSLLMPELSMEVDEAPVITNSDAPAPEHEINKSPLQLYDPIFSTFVDEMTGAEVDFDLTPDELEMKIKTYGTKNPVQFTKIHCTACNVHLGSALDGQGNRFVHPLLKVLICKKCFHFYTSGEFEKDEDGSELYCRWCGQGGQVMCCSTCEMVFCKKCIRINFDRRKLLEIQRSDDWSCFRCNPSQLTHLRIHCAEFMEYVQREIRVVGSAPNAESFMNTDYCKCCLPQKKKVVEPSPVNTSQPKKRKRAAPEDPDYSPSNDRESPPLLSVSSGSAPPMKMPMLIQNTSSSKLTQPRPVTPQPTNRSRVQVINNAVTRPQSNIIRVAAPNVRQPTPTPVLSTRPPALRPIRPSTPTKHEWFEKTVRSSARVNSNLSYTLTQLNRAQAQATSVEALAVVHNRLQEILSSSINSLIQIRKNLRTEFIAGIKNIRFPPKNPAVSTTPPLNTKISIKDDDDVIFIPTDTTASSSKVTPTGTSNILPKIVLPASLSEVSLIKKNTVSKPGPSGVTRIISNKSTNHSVSVSEAKPKGFLRVKSISALQNVSSECITIPDDPADDDVQAVQEKDPLGDIDLTLPETPSHTNGLTNGEKDEKNSKENSKNVDDSSNEEVIAVENTRSVKKAKIVLERSIEIDELVKNKYGLVNGNSDESGEK